MCTVVVLFRPDNDWSLVVAANRDEMADRPWLPPGRHWPDRETVVAGMDQLAGGSWLGINDDGVVVAVLNRVGSLGQEAGKRSRGELVLEALDHADATEAAAAIAHVNPASYRSFNILIADNRDAFWLRSRGPEGPGRVEVLDVLPGLSMITARDCNDMSSPRIATYLPRFRAAPVPDPGTGDWKAWEALVASRVYDADKGPHAAMTIVTDTGFGTTSSSLIAVPAPGRPHLKPVWRFAAGRPDEAPFETVPL